MAAGLPGCSEQAGAPDDPRDGIRLAAVAVAAALLLTELVPVSLLLSYSLHGF